MLGELLRWFLAQTNVEAGLVIFVRAGRPFWYTLVVLEIISTIGLLVPYGFISFILWPIEWVIRRFNKERNRKGSKISRKMKVSRRIFKRWALKLRFVQQHPRVILFVLNIVSTPLGLFISNSIPLPFISYGTIVVARAARVNRAIYYIMAGNFLKILAEVSWAYSLVESL